MLQAELSTLDIELELDPTEYNVMIEKQQAGDFGNFLIGFGNWIRPESAALAMVMQDALHGEGNAKRGGDAGNPIPVRERPYMDNYFHWLDMIIDVQTGNHEDTEEYWRSFNDTFHEVMFAQAIARQRGAEFYTNRVHVPDPGPTTPNPQTVWLEQT